MATRLETQKRRAKLREFLQNAAREGRFATGQMVPPVRELAQRFEISVPLALEVVKGLVEEGVLTTVPSVGTFVGRPTVSQPDLYVLINIYNSGGQLDALRVGFEDRISQLGGVSLILDEERAQNHFTNGALANVAGIFRTRTIQGVSSWEIPDVRHVEFGRVSAEKPNTDMVYFDNVDGGVQATRHLLQLGHSRIAFLGLHGQNGDWKNLLWSHERELGWEQAMHEAGQSSKNLVFQPLQTSGLDRNDQIKSAYHTAKNLIGRSDITGIVATNSFAARGLFEALQDAQIAEKSWPAVVTFDNYEVLEGFPATSLRLPWEKIGSVGADLLWQRRHGLLSGPPQQRLVPMHLISRLSCRPDWAHNLGLMPNPSALTPELHNLELGELELAPA